MGRVAGMGPGYGARSGRGRFAASQWAGAAVVLVGLVVIAGWLTQQPVFTSAFASRVAMKFNTALGLLGLGVALLFANLATLAGLRVRRIASGLVLLLATLTLAEYVFSWDAHIDDPWQLASAAPIDAAAVAGSMPSGRMAPTTALNLLLGSLSVLALDVRRRKTSLQPAEALASWVGFNSLVTLLGYAYGADSLYQLGPYTAVAPHTALALVIVALGVVLARPTHGLPQLFMSTGPGGVLARRLLPSVALLPAVLGWLVLQGQRAGWLGFDVGLALVATINAACLLALAFSTARGLEQGDVLARRAEQALRDSETRKTAMLDASLDCVVSMDEHGSITEFNSAAERTFGHLRQDVLGKPLAEVLVPARLREQHRTGLQRYLSTGQANVLGRRVELTALRADGSELPVEIAIVRIPSSGPLEFTGFIRDLSERQHAEAAQAALTTQANTETRARRRAETRLRQAEEQLRQSQKMEAIGRLAGGVAHDFNNMLSVIIGSASLMRQELGEGSSLHVEMNEIEEAAKRAAELTRQLLAFSRQQVLEPRVVDLNALVLKLDGMLRRMIGEDIVLQVTTDPLLGRVLVDPSQIENVVINLVVNARDAMPRGGRLHLETKALNLDDEYAGEHLEAQVGPHAMVSVSDDGVGMEADTLPRIFEPFFTTKEKDKGTGLGLAMVFGTVTQSGGHIGVESERGKGTTIKLYFPCTDLPASLVGSAVSNASPSRGTEQVLLVEDEEQVRRVISLILTRSGYRVIEASSAEEALRLALDSANAFDLLLTDVVMPGMSGPDLAARLRGARSGLKVLCMSGYTDDAVLRHGLADSGVAFLQKPITPENLARKVRDLLDQA